jgi:hypothetical protein
MAINFPQRTAFAASHRFQKVVFSFSLTSKELLITYFISTMTHCSLSNELFSFQPFSCFVSSFLLLSSSIIALWSGRMHGIIFIFLYLLRLALCPWIWSILEKVPWPAEKNVYYVEVGWNVLWTSTRSIWSMECFRSGISLLIFCLDDLYIDDSGILTSPTTTMLELIYAFRSFRVCLMKLVALTLGAYRLIIVIYSWSSSSFIRGNVLLYLVWSM